MENFNIYGWSALHEACYKGYANAVSRFLDYARETEKNLIEQRTIDSYKTTPIIIAALGGHLDVVELLVKNGADYNAELDFNNTKHGIIEVAAIRQHIDLLVYMNDKIPDIPKRLRNLMISDLLDKQSRASIGRTIETLSQDYTNILEKIEKNSNQILSPQELITYNTIGHVDFGFCLANFLKLNENNEDAIASAVVTLLNVLSDEKFRQNFIKHKGIYYFVFYMENHKAKLLKLIESHKATLLAPPSKKAVSWDEDDNYSDDYFKSYKTSIYTDYTEEKEEEETSEEVESSTWIECASIGQAFNALSKLDDCVKFINNDGANLKIINYVKVLFDYNYYSRLGELATNDSNPNNKNSIIFEQYIGPYLLCIANLAFQDKNNKAYFLEMNLFELILNFWNQIQILNNSNSTSFIGSNSLKRKLQYFAPSSTFKPSSDYLQNYFEQSNSALNGNNQSDENESIMEFLFKNDESKFSAFTKILENISPSLIKNLKLVIIECLGKVLYQNNELKQKYIYSLDIQSYDQLNTINSNPNESDWILVANRFLKTLLSFLDGISVSDRDNQLEVLRFIRFIADDDPRIQNRLVSTKNAFSSSLINSFRNLLRKSSPALIRTSAMYSLWSLTGDRNYQVTFDRKCLLYRAVGVQKFVDALFDSDEDLSLVCLEALGCISNAPPYRENDSTNNKLIHVQDIVNKVHAVTAVLRILKSTKTKLIFATLKAISAMCVTTGYYNCQKNQLEVERLGGISMLIDISSNKKKFSNRLRCEAYLCLGLVCLNNSHNKKCLYEELGLRLNDMVKDIFDLLICSSEFQEEKSEIINQDELEELTTQITAGLAICAFGFKNDEFKRRVVLTTGRLEWKTFEVILNKLNKKIEKSAQAKNNEICFELEKLKCLFGFVIAALNSLIDWPSQDPRGVGMQIMVDLIPRVRNTYLRSIACDYIGRLVCVNDLLVESFMSIGAIEVLAQRTLDTSEKHEIGEAERGNAAISLGHFTLINPEARRNLLKLARKNPKVMQSLRYYNEVIHVDLATQWNHYKELNQSVNTQNRLYRSNSKKF